LSVLVRRLAADDESVAPDVVENAIASASWVSVGEWDVPGRVVVATAYVEPDPETWLVLVRLHRADVP
jgi:hypothetical protein